MFHAQLVQDALIAAYDEPCLMSRANGLPALVQRPRDIKRTVDFMLSDFANAARINPRRIGFYGFSQGGYTGLVIAGANPDFSRLPPRCHDPEAGRCPTTDKTELPVQRPLKADLAHDPRIKAMVVSDPLSVVFQSKNSVKNIRIPIQLWQSELGGGAGASPQDVSLLGSALPGKRDFRIATNAVHLSFLTMCPKAKMSSEVCRDATGFDRESFHRVFNAEMIAFFQSHL